MCNIFVGIHAQNGNVVGTNYVASKKFCLRNWCGIQVPPITLSFSIICNKKPILKKSILALNKMQLFYIQQYLKFRAERQKLYDRAFEWYY